MKKSPGPNKERNIHRSSKNSPKQISGWILIRDFLLVSQDINWWTGVVWIIVMFLSAAWIHSDGTHSLQSIHLWESDAMLHFSKNLPKRDLKWIEYNYFFELFKWFIRSSNEFTYMLCFGTTKVIKITYLVKIDVLRNKPSHMPCIVMISEMSAWTFW